MSTKVIIPKQDIEKEFDNVKSIKELSKKFSCNSDTMSHILIDYGLYDAFFDMKVPSQMCRKRRVEPCCVCGSTFRSSTYKGSWYCKKHYSQMTRNKLNKRTIYDKNDCEIDGNICRIVLRNVKQDIVGYCVIDAEDYETVKEYKWFKNNNGYCVTKCIEPTSNISIHRVLLNYPSNFYCDHINNDKLDNRKSNLRIVTPQENAANMGMKNTNRSGVVGVQEYNKDTIQKWTATLTYKYKNVYLGRCASFDECVRLRLEGEAQYFGAYSNNYNPATNRIELKYFSHDTGKTEFVAVNLPVEDAGGEIENVS
jgi:hypothetical protein